MRRFVCVFRSGTDDLGRVYGVQWTDWKDWQEVQNEDDYRALLTWGYELVAQDQERGVWVMRQQNASRSPHG